MFDLLWLAPLGFVVGAFGTLIGAGGGFILMPILVLLFPREDREILTSISLAVVFFNALSGSWAYFRKRRIDFKSGLLFSTATIPGAILGAITTEYLSITLFDIIFGVLMLIIAIVMVVKPPIHNPTANVVRSHRFTYTTYLIEASGCSHRISYNPVVGIGVSFFVGYLSSLLGIGGGIVHVPFLVMYLDFPVHIATATSHFMLAIMALAGTVVHILNGTFTHGLYRTVLLAAGVLIGAQVGARLSDQVTGAWIMRGLALALGFVGLRILWGAV
ncbi:MAG: sulfite exporter TauE/SafE family protein [bacterium]|nr:sulfite exporter TauE/SafE family protein [bacterium]